MRFTGRDRQTAEEHVETQEIGVQAPGQRRRVLQRRVGRDRAVDLEQAQARDRLGGAVGGTSSGRKPHAALVGKGALLHGKQPAVHRQVLGFVHDRRPLLGPNGLERIVQRAQEFR